MQDLVPALESEVLVTDQAKQCGKPTVLVVDDEPIIADTLVAILNQQGLSATAAYNGTAAIDRARCLRPDLVLTDVVMPDIDGVQVAISIREMLPACKILLYSGQAGTVDLLRKARDGGYDFELLAKPVHPRDLLAKIRSSVDSSSPAEMRRTSRLRPRQVDACITIGSTS